MTSKSSSELPWITQVTLRVISLVTDSSRRRDGTMNRTIANFFNPKSPATKPFSEDVTVDPSRKLWFRIFKPNTTTTSSSLPLIVFFHGGGFAYLSANSRSYHRVCTRFANELEAVVISVDYRLAPEHRYPDQFDDGFDVLKFLDEEKGTAAMPENVDMSRCFLAGDSAGANIAHHVAVRASSPQSTFSTLKVIGVISIQPFFGGEERTEAELRLMQLVTVERTDWMWKSFLPEDEYMKNGGRDHPAVNVSGPRAVDISGLENFPATIVFVGGQDALQNWQRRYYHWLKKSGKEAFLVEYPTMCHAFYVFWYLPKSGQLVSEVAQFMSSVTPK